MRPAGSAARFAPWLAAGVLDAGPHGMTAPPVSLALLAFHPADTGVPASAITGAALVVVRMPRGMLTVLARTPRGDTGSEREEQERHQAHEYPIHESSFCESRPSWRCRSPPARRTTTVGLRLDWALLHRPYQQDESGRRPGEWRSLKIRRAPAAGVPLKLQTATRVSQFARPLSPRRRGRGRIRDVTDLESARRSAQRATRARRPSPPTRRRPRRSR